MDADVVVGVEKHEGITRKDTSRGVGVAVSS